MAAFCIIRIFPIQFFFFFYSFVHPRYYFNSNTWNTHQKFIHFSDRTKRWWIKLPDIQVLHKNRPKKELCETNLTSWMKIIGNRQKKCSLLSHFYISDLLLLLIFNLLESPLTLVMMGGGPYVPPPPKVFLFFYQKSLPLTKPWDPPVNS